MLDDGGATIDPVAAIDVGDATYVLDCGAMDMCADDAVEPHQAHVARDRFLESVHELERAGIDVSG